MQKTSFITISFFALDFDHVLFGEKTLRNIFFN